MAQLRLFTEGMGQGLKIYQTKHFDVDAALEASQMSYVGPELSLEPGATSVHLMDFDLDSLRAGFAESGVPLISACNFTIPDYNILDYNMAHGGSMFQTVWSVPEFGPEAPLPTDYELNFNTKYYIDTTPSGFLFPDYSNAPPLNNFQDQTLYVSAEPFAWAFWTSNQGYFGISHYWSHSHEGGGDYVGESFGFFHNRYGGDSMLPRDGGMSGEKIIDDWNFSDFTLFDSTTATPSSVSRMGAVWVDIVYNDMAYVGILAIAYAADGTPQRARGFIMSARFFDFNADAFYNPEFSEPDMGVGAHNLPGRTAEQTPDRMIPRNMFETGVCGGSSSPGAVGLKLVRMNMATLNTFITMYLSQHSGIFSDQSQAMQNVQNTVLDTFMLPISFDTNHHSNQFEIAGDILSLDASNQAVDWNFSQQQIVDCGVITLPEEEGNYLDYEPFTKAFIYIPYCGQYEIPINSFMGGSIQLVYSVDILTGDCVAYVFSMNRFGNQLLLGTFPGNMRLPIPFNYNSNNLGIIGSALQKGIQIAMTGVNNTGKAASNLTPMPSRADYTSSANYSYGGQSYGSGQVFNKSGYMGAMGQAALDNVMPVMNMVGHGANAITSMANLAGEIKAAPITLSSIVGSFGGSVSFNMPQIPYVKIVKSICRVSETHHLDRGLPSNISVAINDLDTRFTVLSNVRLDKVSDATAQEQAAILQILTTGFYK